MTKKSPFLPMALLLLSSCASYLPFTNHLRNDFHLGVEDMRRVQFYVSDEFNLRRDTTAENARLSPGGVVRYDQGRLIEEILVKRYTPCIALRAVLNTDPPQYQIQVSFMPGDNADLITFGVKDDQQADSDSPFLLLAPMWDGPQAKIQYDNKVWNLDLRKHPQLVVRKDAFYKLKKIIRVLPGRVIN
jgi:hypothetical protein